MKRNCDLDLRLYPSSDSSPLQDSINEAFELNRQHLAILWNGNQCMFDITELQARVILWLASREMEERKGSRGPTQTSPFSLQSGALAFAPQGLSMKRSLQTFLQKRRKRAQSHSISLQPNDV